MLLENTIHLGDCLELMKEIPDASVDMVLCDLPYGTTQNVWDSVLPLEKLWAEYRRVCRGAIVLTASQPFTSHLIMSQLDIFKYAWVWNKVNKFSGHLNAKKQPLRITEDIAVFYMRPPTYNPIMEQGKPYTATSTGAKSSNYGKQTDNVKTVNEGLYYPKNLISIKGDERGTVGRIHPTQKPVALFEYLIKTYTNPGDLVLDNCAGSGTTAVACKQTGRRYLCIEKDRDYWLKACERVNQSSGIL